MAKRFIDTGLFDDDWFSDLSPNAKLLWVYYLTKCDHAGLMKVNYKLISFQTGIKTIESVFEELANRLIRVSEQLIFCPKFLTYQYPGFPDCKKFRAVNSAIDLLEKNNIDFKSLITLSKELDNSYVNGNGKGNVNGKGKKGGVGELTYPFNSAEFIDKWNILIKQPKWKGKSAESLQAALIKLSEVDERCAIQAILDAIAGNWQGIFPKQVSTKGEVPNTGRRDDDLKLVTGQ